MSDLVALSLPVLADTDFSLSSAFHRYRRYPGFDTDRLGQLVQTEVGKAISEGGAAAGLMGQTCLQGCGAVFPLRWDSAHFDMPMVRLQLYPGEECLASDWKPLVEHLLSRLPTGQRTHVSSEVDVDDYASLNSLTALGFEILDLRRTYCTNRMRQDIDFIRMRRNVRSYHAADHASVMRIVEATRFPSRFYRDRHLSAEKVDAMYRYWFDSLLAESNRSSRAVVYEKGGEIVACGVLGEKNFDFGSQAISLRTGSLYAGLPRATGAYPPVMFQLIVDALSTHDLCDTTVSLNNVTVCRVLESFRSYKSAVASYSLRKVLE